MPVKLELPDEKAGAGQSSMPGAVWVLGPKDACAGGRKFEHHVDLRITSVGMIAREDINGVDASGRPGH